MSGRCNVKKLENGDTSGVVTGREIWRGIDVHKTWCFEPGDL